MQLQTGTGANLDLCGAQLEVDYVAAPGALVIDEMGVAAGHRNALLVDGGTEANDRAGHVIELDDVFVLGGGNHLRVGLFLLLHGAGADPLELAVNLDGVHVVLGDGEVIQNLRGRLAQQVLRQFALNHGHEVGDHGVGGLLAQVGQGYGAVVAHLVADAVEDDHFAVEAVEGTHTEVAVAQELTDGHLAIVDAVQQLGHEAGLKNFVTENSFTV